MTDPSQPAAARLASGDCVVGVVGLGYVGLPLVRAIHAAGLRVVGYDIDPAKIDRLRRGESYIRHLDALFPALAASDRFTPTHDENDLADCDAVLLCVPTPLGRHRDPDLRFVERSTEMAARVLRPGALVVLESTTYPGTTREVMAPILTRGFADRGLPSELGRDLLLAYSPEREDPGRDDRSAETIPKLVGGLDDASTAAAASLYRRFVREVHAVSSAEVAEASKLLENIYRAVNIALVNEMKLLLEPMGVDVWEVIEAAKTKPFGFQAFYPGPGLGGHCIPIDPFYLAWKAKAAGGTAHFIELAGEINSAMPRRVVHRLMEALSDGGVALRGARVLLVGVAYKPNVDDIRETPAAEIITLLHERGAEVRYHDPHVPSFPEMRRYRLELDSVPLTEAELAAADAVLIVTHHDAVEWDAIGRHARLIVDTRNAMSRAAEIRGRLVKA